MLFDLLASAILSVSIVLQPQNVYQATSYFCSTAITVSIDILAFVIRPGLPYATVALVCFLLTVYILLEVRPREYHDTEGSVAPKRQLASHGSDPAYSSNGTISGVEINTESVSTISPDLDPSAIPEINTVTLPPTFEDHTKSQKPDIAGANHVIATAPIIAYLDNAPSVSQALPNFNPTSNTILSPSPPPFDISNIVQSAPTAVSIPSSLNIAKLAIAPSISLTAKLAIENPAMDLSSTKVDVSTSSTSSSDVVLATKIFGPESLPASTHCSQALCVLPRLPDGSRVSSPGTICASLTSETNMLLTESPPNHIVKARRSSVSGFSCPKNHTTSPRDISRVDSPVTTVSAVLDINVSPVGAPVVSSATPQEQESIVTKNNVEATRAECNSVSTSGSHPAPAGNPIAQSIPSCLEQVSQVSSDFKHRPAPNSVSSDPNDVPPRTSPIAKPTTCTKHTSKQNSTVAGGLPTRPKRIRIAGTRSPFDRALQAIRDASATLGHAQDRGMSPTATSKKNEARSASLKNEGIQMSNSAEVAVPHLSKGACSAGPYPFASVFSLETVTQRQAIVTPSISDSKTNNRTLASCPVSSGPSNFSDVKNDNENVRSRVPALFDNTLSNVPSIASPINHERVTSTPSRFRPMDAEPAVTTGARSGGVRTAIQKTKPILPVANHDALLKMVALTPPYDCLPIDPQLAPKVVDRRFHDSSAVTLSTPMILKAGMTGTLGSLSLAVLSDGTDDHP